MLELDHAIWFVPGRAAAGVEVLDGLAIEPGRVHGGQGTRNVRVMFERSYLEVLWIEDEELVGARGLDFADRCARPPRRHPFGCVLRGAIPAAERARFVPYELPDAPGVVLQLLASQPAGAPFVAVFETDDPSGAWPVRRVDARHLDHPRGARVIVGATFTCPGPAPLAGLRDVAFATGPARLDLDLGTSTLTLDAAR